MYLWNRYEVEGTAESQSCYNATNVFLKSLVSPKLHTNIYNVNNKIGAIQQLMANKMI